jgi:hypothetical protein
MDRRILLIAVLVFSIGSPFLAGCGMIGKLQKAIQCQNCSGSGKCSRCNGDGWYGFFVTCQSCGGRGKCPKCNGVGY